MKKEVINTTRNEHPGFGAGSGDVETIVYRCPCGRGKIVEEHDNIPGFRDHDVYIDCDTCKHLFDINTIQGVRGWKLDGFLVTGITNSKLRLDKAIDKKDIKEILINLFEFLSWTFSIREKCKIKKETNESFFALKDVLDLIKHDYDLIKLNFLATKSMPGYSYPRSYPYSYTTKIIFGKIDDMTNVGKDRFDRYKRNLESQNLQLLTNDIFNDTIKIYNSL